MEKKEFKDICSLLNFTLNDIQKERRQLEEYQNSLELILEKSPKKTKRAGKKIKQNEYDDLRLKPDLFNQNLDKEYNRIFPLLTEMIKKEHHLKELSKFVAKNNQIIFNLETVLEADVRQLNYKRKELSLSLKDNEGTNPPMIQELQSKIENLKIKIMLKNQPPSKYPFTALRFHDLETPQKKIIIQILKTEL